MLVTKVLMYESKYRTKLHYQCRTFDRYFLPTGEQTMWHCMAQQQYLIPTRKMINIPEKNEFSGRKQTHLQPNISYNVYFWWRNDWKRWHNSIRIFLANFRYKQCTHSRARTTTQRMSQLETLQAITVFGWKSDTKEIEYVVRIKCVDHAPSI